MEVVTEMIRKYLTIILSNKINDFRGISKYFNTSDISTLDFKTN